MPIPNLVYLFEAEYNDGRIYRQTSDDISVKYPPVPDENGVLQGKGAAADIQEDLENNKIIRFSLVGRGNKLTVDLRTGLFEVNGLPILLESETLPAMPERFELVRYYKVSQSKNVTWATKTGEIVKTEDLPEFREYFIGWKCNINGREYKQMLAVS